jgi:tRNA U34 5-methylaminomethyl-2-thiouridine-forming methyltransferase MnmC
MGNMQPRIVSTLDGSHTLYYDEIDEHFHSTNGAIDESQHVYLNAGYDFCSAAHPVVFEAGFGTGLNALLTAIRAGEKHRFTSYITIEKYPLDKTIVSNLNYPSILGQEAAKLFTAIHEAEWDTETAVTKHFVIRKIFGDLHSMEPDFTADVIFYDAFAPSKQPDMWSGELMAKMAALVPQGGVFVTYSARGELKRTLRSLGFAVEMLAGARGKREMIRAVKI